MIVKRDEYVNRLVRLMGNGNIKVITGIRRCGKSFLLNKLLKRRTHTSKAEIHSMILKWCLRLTRKTEH